MIGRNQKNFSLKEIYERGGKERLGTKSAAMKMKLQQCLTSKEYDTFEELVFKKYMPDDVEETWTDDDQQKNRKV